jgi:hypothetical protein
MIKRTPPRNYADLQRLAAELGRPLASLYAMSDRRDPFMAGMPWRLRQAQWFVAVLKKLRLGKKVNVRRIHYRIISQRIVIKLPSGRRYVNTKACQGVLESASVDARHLNLPPGITFTDERNAEPIIHLPSEELRDAEIVIARSTLNTISELYPPELRLTDPIIRQRYHVEIWAEKTTVNDCCCRSPSASSSTSSPARAS